jgi:predicted RNA-binding Zn-ribbon protein involved in translation (DUF1610 family)
MSIKNISCAAALAAALAGAVVLAATGQTTSPAGKTAQPPATMPAGDEAVVTPALAPPRAQAQPAADATPVVVRLQPAGEGDAAREAQLLRKLLAGPPDDAVLSELAALRNRRLQRDADALDALARGLRLYLEVGPRLAAGPLDKATRNPNVFAVAGSLPRPLGELAAQCRAAAAARETAHFCPRCGDTRLAPCARCAGSGYVPCPKCGGAGLLRGSDGRVLGLCGQCGGAGVVRCQACGGAGSVECAACKPKPGQAEESLLPAAEVREIRTVICKARWIRAGGIDLYTNGAREPAPK